MIIPLSVRSIVTAAAAISSRGTQTTQPSLTSRAINVDHARVATSAISALDSFYQKDNLVWKNVRGWIAANVYNDIMDFDLFSHTRQHENTYGAALLTIATSAAAQEKVGSVNDFNDDQLWWCLAMIRAYQNYGHRAPLDQAIRQWKSIGANAQLSHADQGTTPSITPGGIQRDAAIPAGCDVDGAVYWSSQRSSGLNAISTSLYAQVGAWLFALTGDAKTFRGPTDRALAWLQRVTLDPATGIMVVDGLTVQGCKKNPGALTYNTGVYIGALTSMYMSTRDAKYLAAARISVKSATTGAFGNSPPLVVSEASALTTPGDAVQWRDILFRNLYDFYDSVNGVGQVDGVLKSQMQAFFRANYDQIQGKARFGNLYAANWFGKMSTGSDWGTGSVLSNLLGSMLLL
ncbi:glycoside hydrolase family 76 protein [Drepanopeziza brunnea f. sp. 'multigermtubi' MB_m1]|uniref:Glycoside hydrolase family 76 protein n=1 Tax=Marssonina brunnea f. sp. multigermtubi (strain MB_m1) TaxID=1072389 RepID=K1WGI0_MARBU|nr:glycoside hydrolase family 76 protein [Drepanopeziza brunnea f. sp. 'multigermtubi' MB_m1]EKD11981.1 glycoside hydrolase family 76 protein [Drepanopeziza brunnea f. sp. 'multigermtubi' MB_m1]